MASLGPLYGLDAELKAKADAKYPHGLELEVTKWIKGVTGDVKLETQSFAQWLQDGMVLCKLVNTISPGEIKQVSPMKAPFKKMENITAFINAARMLGVPESFAFCTPDLYEEKNMGCVVQTIYYLAGVVQTTCPDYKGPTLGPPVKAVRQAPKAAKAPVTQTGGLAGHMDKTPASTGKREVAKANHDANATVDARGLDADLKDKMAKKFNPEIERVVIEWIGAVVGTPKGDVTSAEWLKSGEVLCELANKIVPGTIAEKDIAHGRLAFAQMENLSKFLQFMRKVGMPENACFSTTDLYEEKNLGIVYQALYTFGGVVQTKVPDFRGPKLGTAVNASVKDESRGLALVTDQNEACNRTMEIERPKGATGPHRG